MAKSEKCFKKDGEPLSEYYSEDEAREGALYVEQNYELHLIPYQCDKCGYWHLSPKERQTPSTKCEFCTDSNGEKKELYESEETARTRAEIIEKEREIELTVYPCPHQNGWHLTKKKRL
jgi:predicted Zn-ribbon and HTH transcriptional regulator